MVRFFFIVLSCLFPSILALSLLSYSSRVALALEGREGRNSRVINECIVDEMRAIGCDGLGTWVAFGMMD